jgi:mannose-6-phosphate isomerase-like protein (cupin superfamily)
MLVTELIDSFPIGDTVRRIQRNEELLLTKPEPGVMKLWRDYDLLRAISFPTKYVPSKFAPPVDVYDSDQLRIEWQKMDFRQPFYHRNADVDEISYHISGKRTLMTEKGSVDLDNGDFARIPVTVAHDNHGVQDVHLIFYLIGPVAECVPPTRTANCTIPPFPGWKANPAITEMMTECLGSPGCDRSVSLADETMLLETAKTDLDHINVLRASTGSTETQWLYKSDLVWLGSTTLASASGEVYRRHRSAEEIQCQVQGRRTLVTQRGTIELEAGDFVSIPLGTAFTDIVHEESTHISVLTRWPAKPKSEYSKVASPTSIENVRALRKG